MPDGKETDRQVSGIGQLEKGWKRAPGIVGRCRVRPCAKNTATLCSQGHTTERLKEEMAFLSPLQRNLKRSLMAVRCFSYFGPSNRKKTHIKQVPGGKRPTVGQHCHLLIQ